MDAVKPPRLFCAKRDPSPYLAALIEAGEPGVLRDLIGITLNADPKWRQDCVSAVSAIAAPLLPDHLPEWDEGVRRSWSVLGQGPNDLWGMKRETVEQLPMNTPSDVTLLGLCASHGNGYVREAAVARLTRIQDGSELAFLILRANDWVPAVQMRASTALMDRLVPSYATVFVRHLALLDYLFRATRADHRLLLDAITGFLQSENARPALLKSLDSPNYRLRRRSYELLFGTHTELPEWLTEKALANGDSVVRHVTYRKLLSPDRPLSMTLVRRAAKDSFARIRRMAFDISTQIDSRAGNSLLREFLFDHGAQLRGDAQRQWRTRGLGDPADVYRSSLQVRGSSGDEATLVAGLGETGNIADASFLQSFLKHDRARVRQIAVRAVCRLQPSGFLNIVTEALFEESPAVATASEACLVKHIRNLNAGELWDRALVASTVQSPVRVLRIFRHLDKWDRLEHLLKALMTSDAVRGFAEIELDDWGTRFNLTFTTLTRDQRSKLTTLLEQNRTRLSASRVAGIEFALKHG